MASELLKLERKESRKRDLAIKDKLIKAVKARDFIWNRANANHKLRDVVDGGWREISKELGIEKEKCKTIWKSLVDTFRNLFWNVTIKKNNDSFDEDREFDRIKWIFFKPMLFLRNSVSRKKTLSNYLNHNQSIDFRENSEKTDTSSLEQEVLCAVSGVDFTIQDFRLQEEYTETEVSSESVPKENPSKRNAHNVGQAPPKKGKNSNPDNQIILDQIQTLNNDISTVSDDRTDNEVFGEYVSRLLNKVPPRDRVECEFEIIKILKEKILQNTM